MKNTNAESPLSNKKIQKIQTLSDANKDIVPNILKIREAFQEAFPHEILKNVEYTIEKKRIVFTFHSQLPNQESKTRTYAQYPGQDFREILRNTPTLDQK